jgi:rhodanese-related sulfurtransferase
MRRPVTNICLLCLVLFFNVSIVSAADSMFGAISAAELKNELEAGKQVVVYDVRTENEYQEGHVPRAINILPQNIRSTAQHLPGNKRQPLVFYCRGAGCTLSRIAAMEALKLGHEDIRLYTGGMPAWGKAGYPVVK